MKFIYLDTETTGLDPNRNGLVQIAGIISADGKTEEFDFVMNPGDVSYDRDSAIINKHTVQAIQQYPPSAEVFPRFIQLLEKHVSRYNKTDKLSLVAYNARFDVDFIRQWFINNGDSYFGSWFWHPALDVMQLAAWHLVGERAKLPNFRLSSVYEHLFGEPFSDAHDALADIKATKRILNHILTKQKGL